MPWSVSADPVDFKQAIAWFLKRVVLTSDEKASLSARAARHAFWVSHVAQLDVAFMAFQAIDAALEKGTTLEDFKKTAGVALRAAWKGTVKDPAWRLETIFRTNAQNAYGAGRYRQATTPEVLEDRPVWMFDAILDGRETEICGVCDGTKQPADNAWWREHSPPLHFNCRSSLVTMTEEQAGKLTTAPTIDAQHGFGSAPSDDEWRPDLTKYPDSLREEFQRKTG